MKSVQKVNKEILKLI